ncbi:uncharacterized protein LOC131054724 isoform X2 [Cryptomeria japonica]|uniref:uncharacterized protein LOC131054724 isoform X2 n=1 Tax=Cryptomeria japonica TaxID=3369 RepID=UPI0025AC4223|nr:uncharacterized protein LOC131054724 isoform X2 [Cryptomeria japonica]
MERSKKRSRGFTAEEMEVADALLMLCHLDCFLVRWAVKRRRSAIARDGLSDTRPTHQSKLANRSPLTALGLSWSESDEFDERAGGPPPSSNTHKELKEMVNTLSSEKSTLKKEEEQLMKTYHELQEQNHHLKSQLAACLNQRREQKLLSTPQPTSSSSDKGSIPGTEAFVSIDDSLRHNEHDSSDHFVSNLALSTVHDEPLYAGAGVSVYPHELDLEASSRSENVDSPRPTKDPSCFIGLSDLNSFTEAICDMVLNGFNEEMLLSKDKTAVAAEARRRRIELTRAKYAQMHKVRRNHACF